MTGKCTLRVLRDILGMLHAEESRVNPWSWCKRFTCSGQGFVFVFILELLNGKQASDAGPEPLYLSCVFMVIVLITSFSAG